jgi:hypothetical protein
MQLNTTLKKTLFWLAGIMLFGACGQAQPPQQSEYSPPKPANKEAAVAANPAASDKSPTQETSSTVVAAAPAQENDFSAETVGAQPTSFVPAVGNWIIGADSNNKVLVVDGSKWKEGQASAGVAQQARALYGERYAEFLDNVKAYAYFPFAVAKAPQDFRQGDITLRFKSIDGRIDQAAGIVFNLKPNGDYLVLRANPLENNLVLFKYERGKRSSVKWIRNTPTASRTWHELKLNVTGNQVEGYLNDKLYLQHTLPAPVSGKVGVWSKADSVVYFDDFRVTPEG